MLNSVRHKPWQKTQLWGLYKTQDGSPRGSPFIVFFVDPKIFLAFAESGEQTKAFLEGLDRQVGINLQFEKVSGEKEYESHQKLYRMLNEASDGFDVLIKMDPDMSIEFDRLFSTMADFFSEFPEIDHAVVPVWDYLTKQNIWGFHAWRGGSRFSHVEDRLFTDQLITDVGLGAVSIALENNSPVVHLSEGSDEQIYRYVLRRLLKSRRYGARSWKSLSRIPKGYMESPTPFRGRAVNAIERALFELSAETICAFALGQIGSTDLPQLESGLPVSRARHTAEMMASKVLWKSLGERLDLAHRKLFSNSETTLSDRTSASKFFKSFPPAPMKTLRRSHLRKAAGTYLSTRFPS